MHLTTEKIKKKLPHLLVIAFTIILIGYFSSEMLPEVINPTSTNKPLTDAVIHFTLDVTATIRSMGYLGVFVLMLIDSSSLPIPSEIILTFSGYLVSIGLLNLWITIAVATVASIAGSLIDYYIGLKGVEALTKYRLLGKALISEGQLKVAASWFIKYGPLMVFLGRLIPIFRTIISFPAGAVKMPLSKFVAYTLAGSVIWNSLLIYIGYYLGTKWKEITNAAHYLIIGAIVGSILLGIYLIVRINKKANSIKSTNGT